MIWVVQEKTFTSSCLVLVLSVFCRFVAHGRTVEGFGYMGIVGNECESPANQR